MLATLSVRWSRFGHFVPLFVPTLSRLHLVELLSRYRLLDNVESTSFQQSTHFLRVHPTRSTVVRCCFSTHSVSTLYGMRRHGQRLSCLHFHDAKHQNRYTITGDDYGLRYQDRALLSSFSVLSLPSILCGRSVAKTQARRATDGSP